LRTNVDVGAANVRRQASIGVAFSDHSTTSDMLVARADVAMYESKRARAGRPIVFDDIAGEAPSAATG
jgi:predicted signal transduction protein with EAL and GGDEF domain